LILNKLKRFETGSFLYSAIGYLIISAMGAQASGQEITRSYIENKILVQGQGERTFQPAGIRSYFEEMKRESNTEIGLKDTYEMASKSIYGNLKVVDNKSKTFDASEKTTNAITIFLCGDVFSKQIIWIGLFLDFQIPFDS